MVKSTVLSPLVTLEFPQLRPVRPPTSVFVLDEVGGLSTEGWDPTFVGRSRGFPQVRPQYVPERVLPGRLGPGSLLKVEVVGRPAFSSRPWFSWSGPPG